MADVIDFPGEMNPVRNHGGDGRSDRWIATVSLYRTLGDLTYGHIDGANAAEAVPGARSGDNLLKLAAILEMAAADMVDAAISMDTEDRRNNPQDDGVSDDA